MEEGRNKFIEERMSKKHPKWEECIRRESKLYARPDDIRSEFYRDYTRILHSHPYSRLKHKTQVFFATQNDHICTRMEHVHHVASVSHTIADFLGLNTELTQAIALSHDIGHAPFGHEGETLLNKILTEKLTEREKIKETETKKTTIKSITIEQDKNKKFWHEQNGLYVVDKIATLRDSNDINQNFNLTYAVRDGIVCHCGEIDENGIMPRAEYIEDLYTIPSPVKNSKTTSPYTWEACVVKVSDKIAYLGRDIQDATELKILSRAAQKELSKLIRDHTRLREINNTVLIHSFIIDLCKHSSPDVGLSFSEPYFELMNKVKEFNYDNIYNHRRIKYYKKYAGHAINTIYDFLASYFDEVEPLQGLKDSEELFPLLTGSFRKWLLKYSNIKEREMQYENQIIYDLKTKKEIDYKRAVVDFIAGMSDNFALKAYQEIVAF